MQTVNTAIDGTNDIRHTIQTQDIDGNPMTIKIRLNDECKNGHNDFAITATVWEKGKVKNDRNMIAGGCCHETIVKAHPELQIFVNLHLCDAKGAPMYAIGNGFFHLKNVTGKMTRDKFVEYYRITGAQYDVLATAEDEKHFGYLLHSLNIPAQWEREAQAAILELEGLTGQKFKDDSKRYQYTAPTAEEIKSIEELIKSGYYNPQQLADRKAQRIQDKKDKLIADLKETRDKDIKEANDEYNIKIAVLNAGLGIDNFIYYNHKNTGVFNWHNDSYHIAVTQDEFAQFLKDVDYTDLPEGITFKLGK